ERSFIFTYLGTEAGESSLGPIIVSYSLEAGERPSAVIREYFQGFDVTITSESSGTRGETDPMETDSMAKPSLVKIVSGSPAVIGESIDVRVIAGIPEEFINEKIRIVDAIPNGFQAAGELEGIESGKIVVESKGKAVVEFSYTLTPEREYSGTLARALLYHNDELLGYSNLPALRVISGDDIAIERIYSTHSTEQNNPVFVSLYLRAPKGLTYAAVEDILPPGSRVLEDSVKANLDENVLSYSIAGEKVVFFINEVGEVSLQYQFIPSIVGEFAVPAAEMYSMYETEKRAESGSDYLIVTEPEEKGTGTEIDRIDLTISLSENGIPDNLTAGMEAEFIVSVYNLGSQSVQVPISLSVDGKVVWRDSIRLPFYSSTEIRIPWIPKKGEHTIKIMVDDLDMVEETNEDNNAVDFTVSVGEDKPGGKNKVSTLLSLMVLTMAATAALTIYIGLKTGRGGAVMTRKGWKLAMQSLKKGVKKGKAR
ncbi:MAG: hypothetical protein KAU14_02735, partial [Thermoplasmata archaeon]|nr:hypothetical protein [Thermoplasmata archaeon]